MGDRGNIKVVSKDNPNGIYFYTHWRGSELPEILRHALIRGHERWTDEAYLNRIIFCAIVQGYEMETTGFGISTYICDNEHPIITVDHDAQTVSLENGKKWPFKQYVSEVRSF